MELNRETTRGLRQCRKPQNKEQHTTNGGTLKSQSDISSSSLKMGRIICELERIYGVRQGGDRSKLNNVQLEKSQTDIAEELGIDKRSYANYKKLTTLIPELQDMVDSGSLTTTNIWNPNFK